MCSRQASADRAPALRPASGASAVTVRDLHKSYGAVEAVRCISLDIAAGECFGLLGPNGAGKSTTVSLAVGLLAPDSGQVTIEGLGNPADPAVRQRMGVAPQALALYERKGNLAMAARTRARLS